MEIKELKKMCIKLFNLQSLGCILSCILKMKSFEIFMAANPDIKIKGIKTMFLNELEENIKEKQTYLFTANACTYQFYEHRGFERVGERILS